MCVHICFNDLTLCSMQTCHSSGPFLGKQSGQGTRVAPSLGVEGEQRHSRMSMKDGRKP